MSSTRNTQLPAAILKLLKRKLLRQQVDPKTEKPLFHEKTKAPLMKEIEVACKENQIFDYRVTGNTLKVVTTDAQKLVVELDDKQLALVVPADAPAA